MEDDTTKTRSTWRQRVHAAVLAGLMIGAWQTGFWVARATPRQPIVVTQETPEARPRSPRTGPPPPSSPVDSSASSASTQCSSPSPGPAWTCDDNGVWQFGSADAATTAAGAAGAEVGGGRGAVFGACGLGQPGPSFVCQNGVWVLAEGSASSASTAAASRESPSSDNVPDSTSAAPASLPEPMLPTPFTPEPSPPAPATSSVVPVVPVVQGAGATASATPDPNAGPPARTTPAAP